MSKKYLTVVVELEGDYPPLSLNSEAFGGRIISLYAGDAIEEAMARIPDEVPLNDDEALNQQA